MKGPEGWIATDDYRWFQRAATYCVVGGGAPPGPLQFCRGVYAHTRTYDSPVLQRRWVSSDGVIKWEDVEVVQETNADAEARVAAENEVRAKLAGKEPR